MPITSLIPEKQSQALQRAIRPLAQTNRAVMRTAKAPNTNPRIIDQRYMSPKTSNDWSGVVRHRRASELPDVNDYQSLALLFMFSDVVFAALNDKQKALTGAKLIVEKKTKETWKESDSHALVNKQSPFNLDCFNPQMSFKDFLDSYLVHQDLFGTFKCIVVRDHFDLNNPTGRVVALEPVMPYCITDRFDNNHNWVGYWYTPDTMYKDNQPIALDPKNVLIDPLYNPFVSEMGVSPTGTLLQHLILDGLISNQNRAFFENDAIPSLIVTLQNTQAQTRFSLEEKLNALKEMWQAKFGEDGYAKRAPAFVTGDIDVKVLQAELDKMVVDKLRDRIESRAAAVYGVTSLWEVHLRHANNRASANEANKTYFYRTLNPFLVRVKSRLERFFRFALKQDERLNIDYSDMAIADFLEDDWRKSMSEAYSLGAVTKDEYRGAYSLLPVSDGTGNDYYGNQNIKTLE